MGTPHVEIVVLHWNNYDDTKRCLDSLKNVTYPDYDVIVVDNGSTDGSGKRLASEYNWCDLLINEGNIGFSVGNNRAIKAVLN